MELTKELNDEIWNYCRANNITNIDEFKIKCLKQGFTTEKFGATPTIKEKIVEKEVEKIIEVPVEKIVEKIVEVTVEKEVFVTDNQEMEKLTNEINKLNSVINAVEEEKNKLKSQQLELDSEIEKLKLELEQEKNKKRRDLYGE